MEDYSKQMIELQNKVIELENKNSRMYKLIYVIKGYFNCKTLLGPAGREIVYQLDAF